MALIKASKKHSMILQTMPIGRYEFEITNVISELNKERNGNNIVFEFTVTEGDFEGKPLKQYCSETADFGIATMVAIYQAISGDTSDEPEFDPLNFKGGRFSGDVDHELYNGRKQERIRSFLKAGQSSVPF